MAKIFSCLHHDSDSLEGQARLNVLIHWQFCVSEGGGGGGGDLLVYWL